MAARKSVTVLNQWRCLWATLLVLGATVGAMSPPTHAQNAARGIFVIRIEHEIDLGLVPYLQRGLDEAAHAQASAILLEINTPGGRLDAVLQMRDAILATPIRTIAFVNRTAFSAGALVAIASDEIYMAPGAVMGAATPVDQTGAPADAKAISAIRKTFKATAELHGRDPRVAEAMVDPDVAIEGLNERGELLTLTDAEALKWGYAQAVVADRKALLEQAGLEEATVTEMTLRPAEHVVRFLTNPLVASLLVSLGFLLIVGDLYVGGFGAVGGVGVALLVLFFWGHFLAGLAGWEGVALVVLGLVLVALEVFIIPGFGVAGLLGVAALLGGLFISLIGGQIVTTADLVRAFSVVGTSVGIILAGSLLLLKFLPRAAAFQGLMLQSRVGYADAVPQPRRPLGRRTWLEGDRLEPHSATHSGAGHLPEARRSLEGATGRALSDLRPTGVATIAGERVDVVTRGDYIAAGEVIEVIRDEGYRRIVRRAQQE